jgi:ferric-dicitrate binding protein FerR (iron transport regulator)
MELHDRPDFDKLVDDTRFIDWVNSDFAVYDDFWNEYIQQYPDSQDIINEAIQFVLHMRFEQRDIPFAKDKLWNRISHTTEIDAGKSYYPSSSSSGKLLVRKIYIGVAAVAALLLLILFFRQSVSGDIKLENNKNEILSDRLPDGSDIILNAGSELTYSNKTPRKLQLKGEAFFKVVKGEDFSVNTDLGTVRVLGTEFNVYARGQRFEVRCYTGKVEVNLEGGDKVHILEPGMGVKWQNNDFVAIRFNTEDQVNDWRSGKFYFDMNPFREVVEEFERQFDVEVVYPDSFAHRLYSGFFQKGDMEKAIEAIAWPLGLDYSKEPGKLVLTEKK